MNINLYFSVLIVVSVANVAVSQLSPEQRGKIRSYIEQVIAVEKIPGLSLAIVYNGFETLESFGLRDVEADLPITPDTLFVLGSTSKAFTATLVSMYYEEMGYRLETPLNQICPDLLVFQDRYRTEHLSMYDLLTHMYCIDSNSAAPFCDASSDAEDFVRRMRYFPGVCEFRDHFIYNSVDVALAGNILGLMTGRGYAEELKTRLTIPLGMNSTVTGPEAVENYPESELAISYSNNGTHLLPIPIEVVNNSRVLVPSGIVVSSARDMVRWMKFHLSLGQTHTGEQLISKSAIERIQTAQALSVTNDETFEPTGPLNLHFAYGLGLSIGTHKGYRHIQHGGGFRSYLTDFALYPELQLGIFTATNGPGETEFAAQYDIQDYILDVIIGDAKTAKQQAYKPVAKSRKTVTKDFKRLQIADTKASVNNSIYVGIYGNFAWGNATVFESESQELRLRYGGTCNGQLEHAVGHTFLFHYDDPLYGIPVPIIFNVPESGPAESARFQMPNIPSYEFKRNLKLSDAPNKPWGDSDCS